jgi:hypothetical protein
MAQKNFGISSVATAPSPATTGTSLVVAAGEGARFLQQDGSFKEFQAIIYPATGIPTPANAEVVTVTGIATDTLTIVREQEDTDPRTIVVGDRIMTALTGKMRDEPVITGPIKIGTGDLVIGYYNLTPSVFDARRGTAAAPDLLPQPVAKVSRTAKLTRAVIEAAGASAAADGVDFAAAFAANVVGTVDNEVQVVGLAGFASSTSTVDPGVAIGGDDSCGVYGVGWTKESGTGAGIGGFFLGRRDNNVGRACGAEIHAANYGTLDSAYDPAGNVPVKGIWLNCSGNADSACGLVLSNAFGRQYEVGIGFTAQVAGGKTGGVRVNSIRDDSYSITSYALNGSHTYGIDAKGGTFSGSPIRLPNNSGIKWRNAADNADMHAVYVNSSNTLNLGESTSQVTISNPIFAFVTTTAISSMIDALSFRMNSSNTPLAGFGLAVPFALKSSTTNSQNAASLGVAWSDPTHATRTAYMRFDTVSNGGALAKRVRVDQTGLVIAAGHKLSRDDDGIVGSKIGHIVLQRGVTTPMVANDAAGIYIRSDVKQAGTVSQGNNGLYVLIADRTDVTTKTITGAANNGSGLIRITSAAHGYATGDRLSIWGVAGTTEANGVWVITVIDANTFDLVGSTFTNTYTSGGTATNRGLYYGVSSYVYPRVARGGITGAAQNGDDVNCFVGMNAGLAKGTDAYYLGNNPGITGPEWITCFTFDADAEYGIRLNGTYDFHALDFNSGVFTGGMIRLKNDAKVQGRNAADSADVDLFRINALNELQIDAPVRFQSSLTVGNGSNFNFSTSTGSMIGGGATQKLAFWGVTPVVQPAASAELATVLTSTGLAATGWKQSFSRGGTILSPATGNNYMVWRAPFACTVTAVKAHYKGGTSVVINARRNQASAHLASNLLVNTANAWADGGAVQNTAYAAGDDLEIQAVTVTGAVTELAIQVDYTRP